MALGTGRCLDRRDTFRGSRSTRRHSLSFFMEGVALMALGGAQIGLVVDDTASLCGRRSSKGHSKSFRHLAWQACNSEIFTFVVFWQA